MAIPSMIFYESWLELADRMNKKVQNKFISAILNYSLRDQLPTFSESEKEAEIAFSLIVPVMQRNAIKFKKKIKEQSVRMRDVYNEED